MYNVNSQVQSFCDNTLASTPQLGNNLNNQTNIHTKTVPPISSPGSDSRCVTPSNIKPGI